MRGEGKSVDDNGGGKGTPQQMQAQLFQALAQTEALLRFTIESGGKFLPVPPRDDTATDGAKKAGVSIASMSESGASDGQGGNGGQNGYGEYEGEVGGPSTEGIDKYLKGLDNDGLAYIFNLARTSNVPADAHLTLSQTQYHPAFMQPSSAMATTTAMQHAATIIQPTPQPSQEPSQQPPQRAARLLKERGRGNAEVLSVDLDGMEAPPRHEDSGYMGGRVSYEYTNGSAVPVTSHSLDASPSPTKSQRPAFNSSTSTQRTPAELKAAAMRAGVAGPGGRARVSRKNLKGVSLPPKTASAKRSPSPTAKRLPSSATKPATKSPHMHFRNSYVHLDESGVVETVDLDISKYPSPTPVRTPAHEPSPFRSTGRDRTPQF